MKKITILVIATLLSACASYPDKVKVPEGTPLVNFTDENTIGINNLGKTARWSGVIADVKNQKSSTTLEVLYYPAMDNGRPKKSQEPAGRFRVNVGSFLDPAIYKKGKSITALGPLKDKETGKIGEYEYEYPTINNATVFLWPKAKPPAKVEFYYGWHGYNPRYYWNGGRRHVYIIGEERKKTPAGKAKLKQNKN